MPFARGDYNKRNRSSNLEHYMVPAAAFGTVCLLLFLGFRAFFFSSHPSPLPVEPAKLVDDIKRADILVPVEMVPVGVALHSAMFRKEQRPEAQITGDMLRGLDELKGLYSRGVLFKGQPVFRAALTDRQPVHVLTAMLPKGYRAVALEVEQPWLDNVDGWAQPGTDVDLVWITNVFGRETASILAGPVRILASNKATEWSTNKKLVGQQDKFVTVTLLLSIRDAVRVSLAAIHGRISLGLRGLGDKRPADGARPITDILIDEGGNKVTKEPRVLSVKVSERASKSSELRRYDLSGRRLAE